MPCRPKDALDTKAERAASKQATQGFVQGEVKLGCTADQGMLATALPLQPHSRVVVPLTLHAPRVSCP